MRHVCRRHAESKQAMGSRRFMLRGVTKVRDEMGPRLRRLETAPAAGAWAERRPGPRAARAGKPGVRDGAARERGRRRSADEAPHGSVAPGLVSHGTESKRRRCPRSRARPSRVTRLGELAGGAAEEDE